MAKCDCGCDGEDLRSLSTAEAVGAIGRGGMEEAVRLNEVAKQLLSPDAEAKA